jgi:hypothetical protein
MLVVFVERFRPRGFLWRGVDAHRSAEFADRRQDLTGDLADRSIRHERDPVRATVAVLDDGVVGVEIECHHQRT